MRVGVVVGVVVMLGLAVGFSARAHGADAPPLEAPPVIRSGAPAAGASGEPTVEILVGDGMAVRDLLLAVSSAAQRTIVWEPQDKAIATRRIVGSPRLRVPTSQLFDAVADLLVPYEILLVPLGAPERPVWFATDARALQAQTMLRLRATPVAMDDEATAARLEGRPALFVTAVLRVPTGVDPRAVRSALGRLVTPNNVGSVQEVPEASALVVTDFAPAVAQMWRTLRLLTPPPTPSEDVTTAYLTLAHRDAADVLGLLGPLFQETAPSPRAVPTPDGNPVAPRSREPAVRIVADVATRTLVVRGTPAQVAEVTRVVSRLDQPPVGK